VHHTIERDDLAARISIPGGSVARVAVAARAAPAACMACRVREHCLPAKLGEPALRAFERIVTGRRRLRSGETLVREADPLRFLYAVRFGTLKATSTLNDGREQVSAFLFAGDVFGLDGLSGGTHRRTLTALEDSEVCAIPCAELMRLPGDIKGQLAWRISELAGNELARDQELFAITAPRHVEPRVAGFLLWMAARMQERGFSANEFELRMTRAELGSYLRVTLESISRALTALSAQGLISVANRRVRIHSATGLAALCRSAVSARAGEPGERTAG
jgi:CRP/FNR family transcriptional regulator